MNNKSHNQKDYLLPTILTVFTVVFIIFIWLFIAYIMDNQRPKSNNTLQQITTPVEIEFDSLAQIINNYNKNIGVIEVTFSITSTILPEQQLTYFFTKGEVIAIKYNQTVYIKGEDTILVIDHDENIVIEVNKENTLHYNQTNKCFNNFVEIAIIDTISNQYKKNPSKFTGYNETIYVLESQKSKNKNIKYNISIMFPEPKQSKLFFTLTDQNNKILIDGDLNLIQFEWNNELEEYLKKYTITNSADIINKYICDEEILF